jgi:hypothetical protein
MLSSITPRIVRPSDAMTATTPSFTSNLPEVCFPAASSKLIFLLTFGAGVGRQLRRPDDISCADALYRVRHFADCFGIEHFTGEIGSGRHIGAPLAVQAGAQSVSQPPNAWHGAVVDDGAHIGTIPKIVRQVADVWAGGKLDLVLWR